MLSDTYYQQLISERCWTIYDLITGHLDVSDDFYLNFWDAAELALETNLFRLKTEIMDNEYSLIINEEYKIENYELTIVNYSYNLIDSNQKNILRADTVPHHQFDYKNKKLINFPHHLHDEKGRICSFSGEIVDFIKYVLQIGI